MTGYSISAYERSFPSGNCKECNWWGKKRLLDKLKMHTSDCLVLTVVFSHVNWALMLSVSAKFAAMLLASLLEMGEEGRLLGPGPARSQRPSPAAMQDPRRYHWRWWLDVDLQDTQTRHLFPSPPPSTPWLQPSLSALFSSINLCELWLAFATFLLMLLTIIDHLGLWQTTEQYQ